jgi:hypothetical protein
MVKLDHDYDREVSGKFAMSSLECLADLILSEYRADERLVEYKIVGITHAERCTFLHRIICWNGQDHQRGLYPFASHPLRRRL